MVVEKTKDGIELGAEDGVLMVVEMFNPGVTLKLHLRIANVWMSLQLSSYMSMISSKGAAGRDCSKILPGE